MLTLSKELQTLFPYQSRSFQLSSGLSLAYVDEGKGEVLLALHGNPTWSFYYRQVIAQFKTQYRVIAIDNLGMGLSDRPESYQELTLEKHIERVFQLLKHLNISKCTLIGHDWGGAIATGVATLASKHNLEINKMILMNTAAFCDALIPWQIALCRVPVFGRFLVRGLNLFAGPATRMAVTRPLSPLIKKGLLFPYQDYASRVGVHAFVLDIPMEADHPTRKFLNTIEQSIPTIEAPVLFIWGGRDFCFTRHFLDRWLKLLPQAQVQYLEDAGHYVLEDAPAAVLATMQNFLLSKEHPVRNNSDETRTISPIQ